MTKPKKRVLLAGYFGAGALERSYVSALGDLECDLSCFDIAASVRHYCRLGKAGGFFNRFVPVEAWIRKANRELVLQIRQFKPEVIFVFGQNPVQLGALAQIRAMMDVKIVYIWPDTLVNLSQTMAAALPMYDLVATYSFSTIPIFQTLGAKHVEWIPLGADPHMHTPLSGTTKYSSDVCFIGQWRPERELAMASILSNLTEIDVQIWGPDWKRRSSNRLIRRALKGRSLYEERFAQAITGSKISLNIIDETNYPAANMRFFEIPCAGGLQVCSVCPEMASEFRHGETIFYYENKNDLPELIQTLLHSDSLRMRVSQACHEKILKEHTYVHRILQIFECLKLYSFPK